MNFMKLKDLSKQMKAMIAAGVAVVVVGGGIIITNATSQNTQINANQAKEIALKDAGVSSNDATFSKAALEKEDGRTVFDVEFKTKDNSYEYTIASNDGDIIDRNVEALNKATNTDAAASITLEEAKTKALSDAGVKESDVTFTKTESKTDDGQEVYEIDFRDSTKKYDYTIVKNGGKIIEKESERLSTNQSSSTTSSANSNKTNNTANNNSSTSNLLGKEKVKSIVLSDAGVASTDAEFTKIKLEYEDGVQVYDVKFMTSSMEYEYEIHAKDGTIRERSSEKLEIAKQPSSNYIGVDSAKNTALNHAGLSAGSVTFTKAKLENDDGISVYEIEFRQGKMEYDYTIDATKGTILEWDKDYDD